jgi:hypothetical protein
MKRIYESTSLYAFLVFIGFYNYFIYYDYFDIDISSFLTVSELLLSFLPLTFSIIIFASFAVFFYIFSIAQLAFKKERTQPVFESKKIKVRDDFVIRTSNAFEDFRREIKEWKWKSFWSYFSLLLTIIDLLIGIARFAFLFLYLIHFLDRIFGKTSFIDSKVGLLMFLGIIWFFTFENLIFIAFKNRKDLIDLSRIILAVIFIIGLISIRNRDKAKKILRGIPEYEIKFENNQKVIQTDSSTLFLGMTEKYIFLRNLDLDKNLIFKIENINGLEMKKVNDEDDKK